MTVWEQWRSLDERSDSSITTASITKRRAKSLDAAKYSAIMPEVPIDLPRAIRLNGEDFNFQAMPMRKLFLIVLLAVSSLAAQANAQVNAQANTQVKLTPKSTTARNDPCAPIGRTEDGKLVYSMKCENLPTPPPPPQAEAKEAPPSPEPESEVRRSGIFGWSYDRR